MGRIRAIVDAFEVMAKKLDRCVVEYDAMHQAGASQEECDPIEREFSILAQDLNQNYETLLRILNNPV